MTDLVKKLLRIAAENPNGFTVTIPDLRPVKAGWCIGHRDTQNSHGPAGLKSVVAHSLKTTGIVGGWKGPDGRYYFDTVIVTDDRDEALRLKREHGQMAAYHLETGTIL